MFIPIRFGVTAAFLFLLNACQTSKQAQLEAVAKDWSSVIRASQVIPVYPLTEDLQPGDVFLVQVPIDRQQAVYRHKGFLPLDNHIARLNPDGYEAFYGHSFLVGGPDKPLPVSYLNPGADKTLAWAASPQAGFPTYSFSVKRGAGFNAALPVHGVPVGLSLLGTDTADGSITIDKARTYGVDIASLYGQVLLWANQPQVQAMLANYAPHSAEQNYLRVVSRVYLVGRLLVTLTDTSSGSGGLDVGAAKPAAVLAASSATAPSAATADNYKAGIDKLNELLAEALKMETVDGQSVLLPGASLRVVAASARSITTAEDFIDRPLVIGYLGFDFPIMDGGSLGPPIPTHARLENQTVNALPRAFDSRQTTLIVARARIAQRSTAAEDFHNVFALMGPDWAQRYDRYRSNGERPLGAYNLTTAEFLSDESAGFGPRHDVLALSLARVADAALAQPQTRPATAPGAAIDRGPFSMPTASSRPVTE